MSVTRCSMGLLCLIASDTFTFEKSWLEEDSKNSVLIYFVFYSSSVEHSPRPNATRSHWISWINVVCLCFCTSMFLHKIYIYIYIHWHVSPSQMCDCMYKAGSEGLAEASSISKYNWLNQLWFLSFHLITVPSLCSLRWIGLSDCLSYLNCSSSPTSIITR